MPARRPRKCLPSDTLAFRLQAVRLMERYIQTELAQAVGCTREAWATYERGRVALPLAVALAFCRRLDISMRWLAEGKEPVRPCISAEELKVDAKALRLAANAGEPFSAAYRRLIAKAAEQWHSSHTTEDIVLRQLHEGPVAVMRRLSLEELKSRLLEYAAAVESGGDDQIGGWISILEAVIGELKHRSQEMYPDSKTVLPRK